MTVEFDLRLFLQLCAGLTALVGFLVLFGRSALGSVEQSAMNWWATGSISYSAGVQLLTMRNVLPDALCIIGGHALTVCGTASFLVAVRRYAQRPNILIQIPLATIASAIAASCYWFLGQTPVLMGILASIQIAVLLQSMWLLFVGYGQHSTILKLLLSVYLADAITLSIWAFRQRYPAGGYEDLLKYADEGALDVLAIVGTFPLLATIMFLIVCAERTNRQLLNSTRIDFLTGALNRRALYEQGERLFMRYQNKNEPFSLLALDIDHFKSINDRYGHSVGDDALVQFTSCIGQTLRVTDVLGRIGGEEFVALLPTANHQDAIKIAERLRTSVVEKIFEGAGFKLEVTASIGVATLDLHDVSFATFLARADAALMKAKANGRNMVVSASELTSAHQLAQSS